jgi:hypothetical protein
MAPAQKTRAKEIKILERTFPLIQQIAVILNSDDAISPKGIWELKIYNRANFFLIPAS